MVTPIRFGRPLPRWAKMPTWPIGAAARVARRRLDFCVRYAVEMIHDFDVGELAQPGERIGAVSGGVQGYRGLYLVPAVIIWGCTFTAHRSDGGENNLCVRQGYLETKE